MRYELSDTEWGAIRVMLPNKLAALPAWMIGVFSMSSSGYCGRAPRGAIIQTPMALGQPATIDLFVGDAQESGRAS